ncbi:DUF3141 domain-containing protein [Noviherbaspirillum cavernae]|uniref:DUF3141 domain-containing protein n=1 Tax=Noviherbaspirillum cavernae TaxID=2320862 RepID=UPI0013143070|nr:DUF3141 domain-containing protein [Noviherbaspirillum cavernae]
MPIDSLFAPRQQGWEYATDFWQRAILFWDVLRQRGDDYIANNAAGAPPPLAFEYDMLVDGRTLARPTNYRLLKIIPPDGVHTDDDKRPYLIIDPRAGHGAGIGGFKQDSQVGVALRDGYPVYFVVFTPEPVPGQTLRDVAAAELHFLREIARRHPRSKKTCIIGNCQAGWAVMALAACEPELTGPLLLNGAPLSYWAGTNGKNPMRYTGGMVGGSWPAYLMSDLGNGKFDGAALVQNFENLNPANTFWEKYYHLFTNIDTEAPRFLEFEKWWGGYALLTREEMRSIVDNLFIGNKLSHGRIQLGNEILDLHNVNAPVVVFCSDGDNITPPQQALNWIADIYKDTREIKAGGKTIVYLVHETIGHLGIFVSGAVARREYAEIFDTLEYIEGLPPGLYELIIDERDPQGKEHYKVRFEEREIADILSRDDGREDEHPFRVVKGLSEINGKLYDLYAAPLVRMMSNEPIARAQRQLQPLRMQHYLWSSRNPFLAWLPPVADAVRKNRKPVNEDNPLLKVQTDFSHVVERNLDSYRDMRDAAVELTFKGIYGWLDVLGVGDRLADPVREQDDDVEQTAALLARISEGGVKEAVVRMMLLVLHANGVIRREGLARAYRIVANEEPFAALDKDALLTTIRIQSGIVAYAPERAIEALPQLLPGEADRMRALELMKRLLPEDGLKDDRRKAMMTRLEQTLGISAVQS